MYYVKIALFKVPICGAVIAKQKWAASGLRMNSEYCLSSQDVPSLMFVTIWFMNEYVDWWSHKQ